MSTIFTETEHGLQLDNADPVQACVPLLLTIDAKGIPTSLKLGRCEFLPFTISAIRDFFASEGVHELTIVQQIGKVGKIVDLA